MGATLCSQAGSLCSCHMWFWMSGLVSTEVVYLRCCLVVAWLVPCETAAVLAHAPCTSLQCHFIWSHRHRSRVQIAVTCHLPFWPNDQDLWHTTAVTRGWNRYQNKSQHRKLTPQKKILLPLLWGLEPETFWSWVQHPATELSLLPCTSLHFFSFFFFFFFSPHGNFRLHFPEESQPNLVTAMYFPHNLLITSPAPYHWGILSPLYLLTLLGIFSPWEFQVALSRGKPSLWQPCTSPTTFWSQVQHHTTEVSSVPCTSLHFLGFFPHRNFRLHFPEESHPCDSCAV